MKLSNTCFKCLFFILFFILGLINNFGYVFIICASSDIAKDYKEESFMSLYLTSLLIFSSFTRTFNSKFCLNVAYRLRVFILSIYVLSGYVLMFLFLCINGKAGFWLSLIPCIILGTGCSFGESTMLGYLRNYPKSLVAGWSSGTGLAGMAGTLIYIMMNSLKVEKKFMFLILTILPITYLGSFYLIDDLYKLYLENDNSTTSLVDITINNDENKEENKLENYKDNKSLNLENFQVAFKKSYWYVLNLFLVYYLEYCISPGFTNYYVDHLPKTGYPDFVIINNFSIMYFCYQIGVFISRTSLVIIKIKRIEIMTIFQIINFVLLFIQCFILYIKNFYILYGWIVFVGLMGGGSYVNCFYFLLEDKQIEPVFRELSVNIATIFNDIGILSASLTTLIFSNTFLK